MLRLLNRICIGALIAIAIAWAGLYLVERHQRAADEQFYREIVAPVITAPTSEALARGGAMGQWMERFRQRADAEQFRFNLLSAGLGLLMIWMLLGVVSNEVIWRKRNASGRAADARAGEVLDLLRGQGGRLVARTKRAGLHLLPTKDREVIIDVAAQTVVFHNFTFVAKFAGNRPRPSVLLPFTDLLGGRLWSNHGRFILNLRTTAGTVTIPDALEPFPTLASVLLDIAEVNRRNSTDYVAALAREPRIRTPWYGWMILVITIALLTILALWLWHLPVTSPVRR